jgi:hypothetical protein
MGSAVLLDTIAISPAISLLQAWLSSSIVKHLRTSLASRQQDFMTHYQGSFAAQTQWRMTSDSANI